MVSENNRSLIIQQFDELAIQYPRLSIAPNNTSNGLIISGIIEIDAVYKGVPLYGDFDIKIDIPEEFPKQFPVLYELSGKIPASFEHKYSDGSCCLGVTVELYKKLSMQPTLEYYINELVIGYFFSVLWFQRFGISPFGERSHGIAGVIEYYKEFWDTDDELLAAKMLYTALKPNAYRGHLPCPCGSGIIGRKCHSQQYKSIFSSAFIDQYYHDYISIYDYINKKRGKNYVRR